MLNWAKLWHGATKGGGVNGYQQGLALALADRGHAVATLSSGTAATPANPAPRLRRHPDWRGIACFEIVNSPVRAPSVAQFDRPQDEVACPPLASLTADLVRAWRPSIVHINCLEGFSIDCVDACRVAGARIVFSLHNYHPICPQVYLMHGKQEPCTDFQNGHRCVGCLTAFDGQLESPSPRPVRSDADIASAFPPPARDARDPAPPDRPGGRVHNLPIADPPSDRAPTAYATRRAAMIAMLNRCDRVLAVSRFVADKFANLGVSRDRLHTMHIGIAMADALGSIPKRAARSGPVRLVFVGFHNRYKGLPVLLDALDALEPGVLGGIHLCVHAKGVEVVEHRLRRLESRLARLTLSRGYEPVDLPHLLAGGDIGVVPSVWWDNAPQTVMEMLACGLPVIGSEVGGIPDFIEHGRNGLLVPGNDHGALAEAIARIVREPGLLDQLSAGVRPPKAMSAHAVEIEELFTAVRAAAGAGA